MLCFEKAKTEDWTIDSLLNHRHFQGFMLLICLVNCLKGEELPVVSNLNGWLEMFDTRTNYPIIFYIDTYTGYQMMINCHEWY